MTADGTQTMTGEMVLWYLDLFEELGIKVWIDGGWGVDALLATKAVPMMISTSCFHPRTRPLLVKHLHGRGFTECPQMTNVSGTSCSVIPNTAGSTSTYSSSPQTIALCIARERSIGISQLLNLLRRVRSQDARSVAFLQSTRCDRFVIEVVVPQLQRLAQGECLVRHDPSEGHWGVDEYDIATQGLVSCHSRIREGHAEM